MNFSVLDWILVVGFIAASTAVAFWTKRRISSYDSFLLAGRNVRLYLAMATLGATEIGLVSLMYFAEQGFASGFSAFVVGLIALAGFIFVGKTGFIIKGLRRLRCRTVSEFFGVRYSFGAQVMAGTITFVAGMMNMGMFLILGAKFLLHMVGFPAELLPYLMIGLLALVLVYTVIGGMVSVVITDYSQFVILFTGILVTTYFAVAGVGYRNLLTVVQEHYGRGGFNPFVNADLGWSFVVWLSIGAIFGGMWPPGISRALSTTDSKTTQRVWAIMGFSFLGRVLLPMTWGICAFAYFKLGPSISFPVDGVTPDTASAMPAFLSQILPAGVMGLMGAAALAGMMSTFDSYLLCWSSIFVNDVVVPLRKGKMTDHAKVRLTRAAVVVCGIFVLVWGYLYTPPETVLRFMAITGTMYVASVLLTIALGLYWKRANAVGAMIGMAIGSALPLMAIFVKDASTLPEGLQWLASDKMVGTVTYVAALAAVVIVSLLTRKSCPARRVVYVEDDDGHPISVVNR